jgi:hypothetical protein
MRIKLPLSLRMAIARVEPHSPLMIRAQYTVLDYINNLEVFFSMLNSSIIKFLSAFLNEKEKLKIFYS